MMSVMCVLVSTFQLSRDQVLELILQWMRTVHTRELEYSRATPLFVIDAIIKLSSVYVESFRPHVSEIIDIMDRAAVSEKDRERVGRTFSRWIRKADEYQYPVQTLQNAISKFQLPVSSVCLPSAIRTETPPVNALPPPVVASSNATTSLRANSLTPTFAPVVAATQSMSSTEAIKKRPALDSDNTELIQSSGKRHQPSNSGPAPTSATGTARALTSLNPLTLTRRPPPQS
jgi:hypothetical protein